MLLEQLHAFALVLDLGIDLGIAARGRRCERRWSIASRCSFQAVSRICRSSARSIRRISGRIVIFDGLRQLAARPLRDRARPISSLVSFGSCRLLRASRQSESSLPLLPVTAPSRGGRLSARRRTACSTRCCASAATCLAFSLFFWLCSTSSARISSRCLFLRSSSVELGIEPLAGPVDEVLAVEPCRSPVLAGRRSDTGRPAPGIRLRAGRTRRWPALVTQLVELRRRRSFADFVRRRARRRTCRAAQPQAVRTPKSASR